MHGLNLAYVIIENEPHHATFFADMQSALPGPLITDSIDLARTCRELYGAEVRLIKHRGEIPQALYGVDAVIFFCAAGAHEAQVARRKSRFYFISHGFSEKSYLSEIPHQQFDVFFAHNARMKAQITSKHPSADVEIVGSIKSDRVFNRHEISSNKKQILYIPTHDESAVKYSSFTKIDFDLFCRQIPDDYHLYVKLHPLLHFRNPARVEAFKKAISAYSNILLTPLSSSKDVVELGFSMDLAICDISGSFYEFLLHDKPLISLEHPQIPAEDKNRFKAGHVVDISKLNELGLAIKDAVTNDPYKQERQALSREVLHLVDGKVGERIRQRIYADFQKL